MVASSHLVDLQIVPQFHLEDSITAHWATVGLCELASANVVGYTQNELLSRGQAKGVGVSFVPVGNATLTLKDLVATGYGDSYADGGIYAKKLNGYGVGGTAYYWFDISDPEVGTLYGWYNDEGSADYNSVELTPGEGLWIYSSSDSYSVVFPAPEL